MQRFEIKTKTPELPGPGLWSQRAYIDVSSAGFTIPGVKHAL